MFSSSKKYVSKPAEKPSNWLPTFGKKSKDNNVQIDSRPQITEHTSLQPTTSGRRGSAAQVLSAGSQHEQKVYITDDDKTAETEIGHHDSGTNTKDEKGIFKRSMFRDRLRECSEGGGSSLNLHSLALHELDTSFSSLKHVRTLSVKKNSFQSVESLLQFQFLEKLDLSFNSLLGGNLLCLRSLGSLQLLRSLDLSACSLALIPDDLRELPQLEELFLRRNLLEDLPDWLVDLRALYILDLSSNRISTVPLCLHDMSSLQILRLEGNPCADAIDSDSKVGYLVHKMKILQSKAERRGLVTRAGLVRCQIVEAEKKWVVSHMASTNEHLFH